MKEDKKLKIFLCIVLSAMIIFTVFSIIIILKYENRYNRYYEYVDLDNNEGIATYCSYSDKGVRSGGQGTPVCKLSDGTIVTVKRYKYIKERLR